MFLGLYVVKFRFIIEFVRNYIFVWITQRVSFGVLLRNLLELFQGFWDSPMATVRICSKNLSGISLDNLVRFRLVIARNSEKSFRLET